MAYKLDRTGESVENLLNSVDDKSIYPIVTKNFDGLMSKEDKMKLDEIIEDDNSLSDEEIRLICV